MRAKLLVGAIACGAILGSAAIVTFAPYCTMRNKRKLLKCKNKMIHAVGTVVDAFNEIKR